MYALCSDAMLKAITRQARAVDAKVTQYNATHMPQITIAYFFDHLATDEDTAVMVTEQDFMDAHRELVPSVSADELRHYDRVRRTFEGAGKGDEKKKQAITNGTVPTSSSNAKGKGRAVAPEEAEIVTRTENIDLNGSSNGAAVDGGSGSGSQGNGKGKGKAPVSGHASKNSVDIAEGGFGDAGDDEELYS
jgi:peroxin-6